MTFELQSSDIHKLRWSLLGSPGALPEGTLSSRPFLNARPGALFPPAARQDIPREETAPWRPPHPCWSPGLLPAPPEPWSCPRFCQSRPDPDFLPQQHGGPGMSQSHRAWQTARVPESLHLGHLLQTPPVWHHLLPPPPNSMGEGDLRHPQSVYRS